MDGSSWLMPIGAPGKADLGQAGADAVLAGEERGTAGGARLLAVVVLEADALLGDAVDVRRLVAHQAAAVGADVGDADVVAEDHQDVGLAAARLRDGGSVKCKGGHAAANAATAIA